MNQTELNPRAIIGGNAPPDPLEEILARFGDAITEAENWLDGEPVTNADQMRAADALAAKVKAARKAVDAARDEAVSPLHAAWKAEVARWKPTQDDLDRIAKGLALIVNDFKNQLAKAQAEERRKAYAAAEAKKREAEAAAAAAKAGDIDALRAAETAKLDALDAAKAAQAAGGEKVKGLRKVHRFEIISHREALYWIAAKDREAITEFIDAYVARNHKRFNIDGVKQWEEKEAF